MRRILLSLVALWLLSAASHGADPRPATVAIRYGGAEASGTCVRSAGGVSVVATVDHLTGGVYPAAVTVVTREGKRLTGTAVRGDAAADVALVVVAGPIPVADLADADAPPGVEVWHAGQGSGGGRGRAIDPARVPGGAAKFVADSPSLPGDSGAGVFDAGGRLVAVHGGRLDPAGANRQYGARVSDLRKLLDAPQPAAVVWVEQTVANGDGTTFTRIVSRPAK